jgi:predicted CopG family antitoxin
MASKNIAITEDVYAHLKAHKRGDESFSEALDRILRELDSDWRTHVGFLSEANADDLEAEISREQGGIDEAFDELGDEIDE